MQKFDVFIIKQGFFSNYAVMTIGTYKQVYYNKYIKKEEKKVNVMLIGSGGREHALCWALSKSNDVSKIVCIPGNAGTAYEAKAVNISLPQGVSAVPNGIDFFADIARKHKIDFALIGPEAPLCAGLTDELWKHGIPVVGPKKAAAQLEGSKDFAKAFMKKYGIACADSVTVTNVIDAKMFIEQRGAPLVVKADGLAGGKGVVVAKTKREAIETAERFMKKAILGEAGKKIILEEYLRGSEISILARKKLYRESRDYSFCPRARSQAASRRCKRPEYRWNGSHRSGSGCKQ